MPDIGIDHDFLLRTLREWLTAGVSASNLASSVRINDFRPYSGGLKAKSVGELSLDLKVTIKVGPGELIGHKAMMNHINQCNEALKSGTGTLLQDRIFPEVMCVEQLPQDAPDGTPQYLMLMQSLAGYHSLEDILYERNDPPEDDLRHQLDVVLEMLGVIHGIRAGDVNLPAVKTTPSPFQKRISGYLERYYTADPLLAVMRSKSGRLNGKPCPPLGELLKRIDWPKDRRNGLSLVHGDAHLGNIMLRRRGPNLSVRLIDPNPEIGYSLPLYDYGKLYHFADPVGWARRKKQYCSADFACRANRWSLDFGTQGFPGQIEAKREQLVHHLNDRLSSVGSADLAIARASAHVALAVAMANDHTRGRFCLGHTISHLLAGAQ